MKLMIAIAALLAAAAAQAGTDYGRHSPMDSVDTNKDGAISREEAKSHAHLLADFDTIDANKDGQLDKDELTKHHDAHRSEMRAQAVEQWKAADTDGNGDLSRAEAAAQPRIAEHFDKLDADGNGQLTPEEMRAARKDVHENVRMHGAERFKSADVNGDGAIDLAEAQTGMPWLAGKFSTVDTDNDGKVTPAELRALKQQ